MKYYDDGELRRVVLSRTEQTRFETTQNVDNILAACREKQKVSQSKDLRHIGEIPVPVYEKAIREGWADDPKRIRQWLNENKEFKTVTGKL